MRNTGALLDLLGAARHSALPPQERVLSDLNEIIERATLAARETRLPEPASLSAARRVVEDAAAAVHGLDAKADKLRQQLATAPSRTIWTRWLGDVKDPDRLSAERRLRDVETKLPVAYTRLNLARTALTTEENKFQKAQTLHQAGLPERRAQAESQMAIARLARSVVGNNPRCAPWGAARLLSLAASLQAARARRQHDDEPTEQWVTTFDIWGIPSAPPPPKIF